jgi:carnitine 3-dehydrogenase
LPGLYDIALPPEGGITRAATLSEAVAGATWIQESGPDRLELKRKLYQKVQETCDPDAVLASSSNTFTLAELQGCATRPAQIVIAAPGRPAYLIPTVSLSATGDTAKAAGLLAETGLGPPPETGALTLTGLDEGTTVALLRSLKARDTGAGRIIARHEATLAPPPPDPDRPDMPVSLQRQVPVTWVDYNGHMNEAFYLTAFSQACDRVLTWAGMDLVTVADNRSIFTVETHIRHLDEVHIGDTIRVRTRIVEGGGKKLHIWQEMSVGDRLCATGEQLLLHMDLTTRRSAPPAPHVADWLGRMMQAHAGLPRPEGLGRFVAQRG